MTIQSNANIVGRAGEFLVCADILSKFHECFVTDGKAQYDLIMDYEGKLLKVQVKTTAGYKNCPQRKNATPVYMFNARKYGKGARHSYALGDADIVAFVALDSKKIAYMCADSIPQSITFRIKEFKDKYYCKTGMFIEDYPLEDVLNGA